MWLSHCAFCPPLAVVPASSRSRYPSLWFAKAPRPAVVGQFPWRLPPRLPRGTSPSCQRELRRLVHRDKADYRFFRRCVFCSRTGLSFAGRLHEGRSRPAISPAVVVPATTPLARHFRVGEGKPLLVEWVGPDAQGCPLCPARPVGRNCYASHMSRCHHGEAAVTSREHFAAVIEEEGSAEAWWVGFAPTRIPKPTEAMSRLVPAPCLATYASLAVGVGFATPFFSAGSLTSAVEWDTHFRFAFGTEKLSQSGMGG